MIGSDVMPDFRHLVKRQVAVSPQIHILCVVPCIRPIVRLFIRACVRSCVLNTGGILSARLRPNRFTYLHIIGTNQLHN